MKPRCYYRTANKFNWCINLMSSRRLKLIPDCHGCSHYEPITESITDRKKILKELQGNRVDVLIGVTLGVLFGVLDEMVHAVACVAHHYGPRLNESGLKMIRDSLNCLNWYTDACFIVDWYEDDPYIDFHQRIIWPDGWDRFVDTLQTGREA